MLLSDFKLRPNKIIRNKKLINDELENNDMKTKGNILFDAFVDNISKNILLKTNDDLLDLKLLKKLDSKCCFNTKKNKPKFKSINHTKESLLDNNNYKINNNHKDINLNYKNKIFYDINNNNKIANKNILETENDSITVNSNGDLLKLKIKNFLLSSKVSFNEENKFNDGMKKIIQKLRIFNVNSNPIGNKLNMPKINDNINHNCCFILKRIDNNKKDSYTMTNDTKVKNKSINKNQNESLNNNLRYINNNNNLSLRIVNNISLMKLNKSPDKNLNKRNENNRESIIRKLLQQKMINKNCVNEKSQKIAFIENYLNKRDFSIKGDRKLIKKLKRNRDIKKQKNNKIFKSPTIKLIANNKCLNINNYYNNQFTDNEQ